jgi:hypothetical protein
MTRRMNQTLTCLRLPLIRRYAPQPVVSNVPTLLMAARRGGQGQGPLPEAPSPPSGGGCPRPVQWTVGQKPRILGGMELPPCFTERRCRAVSRPAHWNWEATYDPSHTPLGLRRQPHAAGSRGPHRL